MSERDIPQKPIKSEEPRYGMGYEYFDWVCPTCGRFLAYEPNEEGIPKRCQNCGQLILRKVGGGNDILEQIRNTNPNNVASKVCDEWLNEMKNRYRFKIKSMKNEIKQLRTGTRTREN